MIRRVSEGRKDECNLVEYMTGLESYKILAVVETKTEQQTPSSKEQLCLRKMLIYPEVTIQEVLMFSRGEPARKTYFKIII